MGFFTDLFSSKPAEDAAQKKIAGINAGMSAADSALTTGQASADALYSKAYSPFESLYNSLGGSASSYADATGANGSEGLNRARTAFTSMPGYQEGINMTLDQNDRRAAARGILASGNTIADTTKLATDYSNQKYSDYVNSLLGGVSQAQTAARGGASVLGANAAADLGVASQKANYGYTGNAAIGSANADAETAKYGASQNFWNTLLGGANLALKASGVGGFGAK